MQQQQQPAHLMGPMAIAITTEQIQKYLDENKQLILAILDNQNLGRLAECAQYQAQLQKNLLYLAAIADAQPESPAVRPQMIPHAVMSQGGGGPSMQQTPNFPPRTPLQFTPQQVWELQQQQPHMMPFPGHMSRRPVSVMNGSNKTPSKQDVDDLKKSATEQEQGSGDSEATPNPKGPEDATTL